jgi:hypothetical protein
MSGMGTSQQNTQQAQQSQSAPWQPAQGNLLGILSGIGGQLGNYQPTGAENNALSQWQQNAAGLQNFTGQATNAANRFMTGDPTGLLGPAYQQYQNAMNPIANASLDPTQTPGMSNLLSTIRNDVSNNVNSEFAGAGRSMSGLNTQALARGISQGEAAPLLGQYNQNVSNRMGAAGGLMGAGLGTAGAMNQATGQGFGMAGTLPGFAAQGPQAQLAASQAQRMLPLQNLGALENLTVPIAGLGGQSSGTSVGQTQNQMSPIQEMMALLSGGPNGVLGGMGALGQTGLSGLSGLGGILGQMMIPGNWGGG